MALWFLLRRVASKTSDAFEKHESWWNLVLIVFAEQTPNRRRTWEGWNKSMLNVKADVRWFVIHWQGSHGVACTRVDSQISTSESLAKATHVHSGTGPIWSQQGFVMLFQHGQRVNKTCRSWWRWRRHDRRRKCWFTDWSERHTNVFGIRKFWFS